jgi:tetratricopeptide (TPR) repeat protein
MKTVEVQPHRHKSKYLVSQSLESMSSISPSCVIPKLFSISLRDLAWASVSMDAKFVRAAASGSSNEPTERSDVMGSSKEALSAPEEAKDGSAVRNDNKAGYPSRSDSSGGSRAPSTPKREEADSSYVFTPSSGLPTPPPPKSEPSSPESDRGSASSKEQRSRTILQWPKDNFSDSKSLGSLATGSSISSQRKAGDVDSTFYSSSVSKGMPSTTGLDYRTPQFASVDEAPLRDRSDDNAIPPSNDSAFEVVEGTVQVKESTQVQRAKGIILRRAVQDIPESKSLTYDYGSRKESFMTSLEVEEKKSDVGSAVSDLLVGLNIDIDLPPSSPSSPTYSEAARVVSSTMPAANLLPERAPTPNSPFDEATLSQSSSQPFDEKHCLRTYLDQRRLSQNGQSMNYPMIVQERMISPHQSGETRSIGENMSDLTGTVGHSSSSSLSDALAHNKVAGMPPLLHKQKFSAADLSQPPPPPLPAQQFLLMAPHLQEKDSSQMAASRHRLKDGIIRISVSDGRDKQRISPTLTSSVPSPFQSLTTSEGSRSANEIEEEKDNELVSDGSGSMEDDEDQDDRASDDESSDPFEGYEDFDEDDMSGEITPNYSGDLESEEGYTRFAKEDFTSDDDDSTCDDSSNFKSDRNGRGSRKQHKRDHNLLRHGHSTNSRQLILRSPSPQDPFITSEDVRQPSQNQSSQMYNSSSGSRESPVSSPANSDGKNDIDTKKRTESRDHTVLPRTTSPTFRVSSRNESALRPDQKTSVSTEKGKSAGLWRLATAPPPPPKRAFSEDRSGSQQTDTRDSPGNRIVKALSNSIRRRRKQSHGFNALGSRNEEEEEEPEGEQDPPVTIQRSPLTDNRHEDEEESNSPIGPIPYVSMTSPSYEETVSQITLNQEEFQGKPSNKSIQWWGIPGLSAGKLEGWFPNTYLNQAVEAAEGFLSAKSIHAQMKSKPLDFDTDNEAEDDDAVIQNPPTQSQAPVPTKAEVDVACASFPLLSNGSKVAGVDSPDNSPNSRGAQGGSVGSKVTNNVRKPLPDLSSPRRKHQLDESFAKANLANEIDQNEKLLQQFESESSSSSMPSPKVASTLFRLAVLYIQNENIDGALKVTKEALRMQKILGNPADASSSLHLLADIYVRKGEYNSALECYAEVQGMELQLYGYIHEETANTLNRIGSVLARQSKFGLAMEKHQEALRILKECHGEELRHPLVSQTLIHIGAVYYRERNSLATVRKNVDGYSTFIEAGMLEVIGRAHEDRGSYKMAISFFEEKLQFLNQRRKDPRSANGLADLEDVATTLNSLGMLSCRAGFFMEAIDYYEKALDAQKKIGCDKIHVATARVLTATVQFHLGYFQKALDLLQDALEELQIETGKDHETVAATWFQIGVVQMALCEYDDAMDALEEALRIQNKFLGKFHPATLRTRREIGNMYAIYETELEAAFVQFQDILATQRQVHGHKHPNVAETLHSLGCAYARKGDYSNAIKTLEECYYMRVDFLGADHPLQATTLHEIAHIHMKRERYKKALHICNAVLEIRKESLSERHVDVARALATKGSCLVVAGDYDEAMKCLMEALPMAEQSVGPSHPAVADIYAQLGAMHLRKCHFDEAKESVEKALDIYQNSNLDEDHPSLQDAMRLMERIGRDEMLCV